jgi:hypothetical protein
MAARDAYMCDVIVIPTDAAADHIEELTRELATAGLDVRGIDQSQCAIEGTINAAKVRELEHHVGVQYVRCVYSYIADYPVGDPRDLN